jgi:predicted N-acetyltransferase YhbS
VLGDPEYYQELGYECADNYKIYAPFDVPKLMLWLNF